MSELSSGSTLAGTGRLTQVNARRRLVGNSNSCGHPLRACHGAVMHKPARRGLVFLRRIGKWLTVGLIAATAVNTLAQPLAGCRMRADAAPTQTAVQAQQDEHPCHGHGTEAAVTSNHDGASNAHGQHCAHAGSCTCCATGVCGGAHPALNTVSMGLAVYDRNVGRAPRLASTDAPRAVYHDPPLRPPAVTIL